MHHREARAEGNDHEGTWPRLQAFDTSLSGRFCTASSPPVNRTTQIVSLWLSEKDREKILTFGPPEKAKPKPSL